MEETGWCVLMVGANVFYKRVSRFIEKHCIYSPKHHDLYKKRSRAKINLPYSFFRFALLLFLESTLPIQKEYAMF